MPYESTGAFMQLVGSLFSWQGQLVTDEKSVSFGPGLLLATAALFAIAAGTGAVGVLFLQTSHTQATLYGEAGTAAVHHSMLLAAAWIWTGFVALVAAGICFAIVLRRRRT